MVIPIHPYFATVGSNLLPYCNYANIRLVVGLPKGTSLQRRAPLAPALFYVSLNHKNEFIHDPRLPRRH